MAAPATVRNERLARAVNHPEEAKALVQGGRIRVSRPSPATDIVENLPFEQVNGGDMIAFGTVADDGFFDMTKAHFQLYGFGMGRSLKVTVGARTGEDKKFDYRYDAQEVIDLMSALGLQEIPGNDPTVVVTDYGDQYIKVRFGK